MGVLPLQFVDGQSAASLGLTGHEHFSVEGVKGALRDAARHRVAIAQFRHAQPPSA